MLSLVVCGVIFFFCFCCLWLLFFFFFFFNDTATTEIYTLSLHDALPICNASRSDAGGGSNPASRTMPNSASRSEEHTSELQSRSDLVCRLLLEKKKKTSLSQRHDQTHPASSLPCYLDYDSLVPYLLTQRS